MYIRLCTNGIRYASRMQFPAKMKHRACREYLKNNDCTIATLVCTIYVQCRHAGFSQKKLKNSVLVRFEFLTVTTEIRKFVCSTSFCLQRIFISFCKEKKFFLKYDLCQSYFTRLNLALNYFRFKEYFQIKRRP